MGKETAVRCNHADDDAVATLFPQVEAEQGHLDVLVNNAIATPDEGMARGYQFWEQPLALWDRLLTVWLRSHYVASVFAARLMVPRRRGLIVNISSVGAIQRIFSVPYGVGKPGIEKLTADTAEELRPHGVAVAALASDPRVIEQSGQSHLVAVPAEEYGVTDLDGTKPAISPYSRRTNS